MSDIEQIFNELPPGVWDRPKPEDQAAYDEFVKAWSAGEDDLLQHWEEFATDGPTLRALSYSCLTEGTDSTAGRYGKYDIGDTVYDGHWWPENGSGFDNTTVEFGYTFVTPATEPVDLPDAELTAQTTDWNPISAFLRFTTDIPTGASINYARLKFTCLEDYSVGDVSVRIAGGIPSTDYPSDTADCNLWERTDNRKDWTIADNWSTDAVYYSPNIACVVQELIDAWWYEGDLLLFVEGFGGNGIKEAYDYSASVAKSTDLEIWWSMQYAEDVGGGVKLDGSAPVQLLYLPPMEGGVLLGGLADVSKITTVPTAVHGKVLLDGVNSASLSIYMMGGVKLGGAGVMKGITTLYGSGGVKLAGYTDRYPNGYIFRCLIRVPAGEVSQALLGFPLLVSWLIEEQERNNITGAQSDFRFETLAGSALTHKVARWDGSRIHAIVKTDLLPQDNWIRCYYGV